MSDAPYSASCKISGAGGYGQRGGQAMAGWVRLAATLWMLILPFSQAVAALDDPAARALPELHDLIQHMEALSPRMLAERATLDAAAADRAARRSVRLPRLDMEANLAHREEFRDQYPRRQSTTRPLGFAAIRQPLYHWGALNAERDIGEINEAIQQERYEDAGRLLIHQARRLYLEMQVTRSQLNDEQHSIRAHADLRDRERERFQLGEITADQAERAELDYQEARLQEERIRYHLLNLDATLRRISGWKDPWAVVPPDLDDLLADIGRQQDQRMHGYRADSLPPPSADYRILQKEMERETRHYTIIQARTRPLVNLVGNVIQDQVESVGAADANRTLVQVMLQVRWNIFDGFDTRYRKLESLARQRSLRHEAEIVRSQDLDEAGRLLRETRLLGREIDLMTLRQGLQQRELERAERNFDAGEIPAVELERIRRTVREIRVNLGYARVRQIDLNQRLQDIHTGATGLPAGIRRTALGIDSAN